MNTHIYHYRDGKGGFVAFSINSKHSTKWCSLWNSLKGEVYYDEWVKFMVSISKTDL